MRLIEKIKAMHHANSHRLEMLFYIFPYLFVFFVLGMGAWIAYQRNLFGYIFDPNSAVGRGSFKLLADIHKVGWQVSLGWIVLHVGMVIYRDFFRKESVLERMWFRN